MQSQPHFQSSRVFLSDLSKINFGIQTQSMRLSRTVHSQLVQAISNANPIFFLFDKDGLLVNSEFLRKVAWIYAFEKFGIQTGLDSKPEALKQFADDILSVGWDDAIEKNLTLTRLSVLSQMGGMTEEKVNQYLFDNFGNEIRKSNQYQDDQQAILFLRQYRKEALKSDLLDSQFDLKPAVRDLLIAIEDFKLIVLNEFGCKVGCAVVTSDNRTDTESDLKRFGIEKYFDTLVCAKEAARSKPHPDCFIKAKDQLSEIFELSSDQQPLCLGFEDAALGVQAFNSAGMSGYFVPDLVDAKIDLDSAIKSKSLKSLEVALFEALRVARLYQKVTSKW